MGADPYPGDSTPVHYAECKVVVTNSNRNQIFASFQSPKPQRGMRGIVLPKIVVLFGEALDILGQVMEEPPKSLAGLRLHRRRGQSFRASFFESACASWRKKSSLPAAASRSSCFSQHSASISWTRWAT